MNLTDFHYDLPEGRIAQEPVSPRDQARLLSLDAATDALSHHRFFELDRLLRPGDVLVTNATKVFPARLRGKKETGGKAEILLLAEQDDRRWRALVRGAMRPLRLVFPEGLTADMTDALPNGEWLVTFSSGGLRAYLDRHGEMPLPPYIKRASARASDLERYQTVFAASEGAVAAPTAGFHFTPELLSRLAAKGVESRQVTLHVGWGTFRPVRAARVEDHAMLPERYEVTNETAEALTRARREGRRIVAVGTTVVRTLESVVHEGGFKQGSGEANLFIYPGYRFQGVDALITNFHLPDSTPLLLANAFYGHQKEGAGAPRSRDWPFGLKAAYLEAIREGYRFYSYGDAMVIQ